MPYTPECQVADEGKEEWEKEGSFQSVGFHHPPVSHSSEENGRDVGSSTAHFCKEFSNHVVHNYSGQLLGCLTPLLSISVQFRSALSVPMKS